MIRSITCCFSIVIFLTSLVEPLRAEVTAEQVRDSIERARDYLKGEQSKINGSWPDHPGQKGGVTALCTLALLNAGVAVDDSVIQNALGFLRGLEPEMTYSTALQTMAFCAAEPEKDMLLIRRNVRWLESIQLRSLKHPRRGAWAYSDSRGNGDNSNAQFALLALHEASLVGVEVSENTWELALDYWMKCQKQDGAWGYLEDHPSTGSMTCAGIASMIVCMEELVKYNRDARVIGERISCCGGDSKSDKAQRSVETAIQWLGEHFSVDRNPSPVALRGALGQSHLLYYLYGMERVGRFSGRRFLGKHDWYRKGAEKLASSAAQDPLTGHYVNTGYAERNPHIATSLALLFLSKGRRPILMAKYKYTDDREWDLHPRGVHNLAQSLEKRWKQPLTWQSIEARAASVNDVLETPVLFITGRNKLELAVEQKDILREYVNQGGFIFVEACNGEGCAGAEFDLSFRELIKELFPDSLLRRLPPEHPIWYAERKVIPTEARWLWGLDACCRTSVVYCPTNLSCHWELSRVGRTDKYPDDVKEEIDRCVAIGQNVLAYATNREVKAKLERPKVITSDPATDERSRGILRVAKLRHTGGSDDAPNALKNLLDFARHELDMNDTLDSKTRLIAPDDSALFDYPIVFIHGRRDFRLSSSQRKSLATYLRRGGFLFGDAICASSQFANAIRRELAAVFPDASLERIPSDDPLLSHEFRGYDLRTVSLRSPHTGGDDDPLTAKLTKTEPYLEGLKIDGRYVVIFSPYDISCAMENHASLECKGYIKEDAAKIGLNLLLYALQQ